MKSFMIYWLNSVNAGFESGHCCPVIPRRVERIIGDSGTIAVDVLDPSVFYYYAHSVHASRGRRVVSDAFKEEDECCAQATTEPIVI